MKLGIKTVRPNGKVRTMETVNLFAIINAQAEYLPHTIFNVCNVKGHHVTYNMPELK